MGSSKSKTKKKRGREKGLKHQLVKTFIEHPKVRTLCQEQVEIKDRNPLLKSITTINLLHDNINLEIFSSYRVLLHFRTH